jgi:hypothetical protein
MADEAGACGLQVMRKLCVSTGGHNENDYENRKSTSAHTHPQQRDYALRGINDERWTSALIFAEGPLACKVSFAATSGVLFPITPVFAYYEQLGGVTRAANF